jgi:hypothetical protein
MDVNIGDAVTLKFVLQSFDEDGKAVYAIAMTAEGIEQMQDDMDLAFPRWKR